MAEEPIHRVKSFLEWHRSKLNALKPNDKDSFMERLRPHVEAHLESLHGSNHQEAPKLRAALQQLLARKVLEKPLKPVGKPGGVFLAINSIESKLKQAKPQERANIIKAHEAEIDYFLRALQEQERDFLGKTKALSKLKYFKGLLAFEAKTKKSGPGGI